MGEGINFVAECLGWPDVVVNFLALTLSNTLEHTIVEFTENTE